MTDYVTKAELKAELINYPTRAEIKSLFEQSERNIGAIVEHFKEQVDTLLEGVFMQIEKVERLRLQNDKDHENYEARLSRLELWCKRWKKK